MQRDEPSPPRWNWRPVGVPRRFSLGRLLLMTAMFSVLFALMQSAETSEIVFAEVGVFFAGVAAAQAILFGGKRPRLASVVGGFLLGPMVGIPSLFIAAAVSNVFEVTVTRILIRAAIMRGGGFAVLISAAFVVLGAPLGYLAGCLVASLFLVKEQGLDTPTAEADPIGDGKSSAPLAPPGEDPSREA